MKGPYVKSELTTRLTLDLPKDEVEKLKLAAKSDDRTVTSYLRHVVRKTLEQQATA